MSKLTSYFATMILPCWLSISCNEPAVKPELKILDSGAISGVSEKEQRFLVISDLEEFRNLYKKIHSTTLGGKLLPEVDFKNYLVLVGLMGQKPTGGYTINFGDIVGKEGEVIEVKVTLTRPAPDAILAQVITSPYVIALVNKNKYKKVAFVDEEGKALEEVGIE